MKRTYKFRVTIVRNLHTKPYLHGSEMFDNVNEGLDKHSKFNDSVCIYNSITRDLKYDRIVECHFVEYKYRGFYIRRQIGHFSHSILRPVDGGFKFVADTPTLETALDSIDQILFEREFMK